AEKGPYKRRVLGTDLLQFSYIERAAGDIRQRLHRDTDGRINNELRPCNISGHENGQNLPPPVLDMSEAGRPTGADHRYAPRCLARPENLMSRTNGDLCFMPLPAGSRIHHGGAYSGAAKGALGTSCRHPVSTKTA